MSQISQATENYVLDNQDTKVKAISDSFLVKMLWRFLKPYSWQLLGVFALLITVSSLQLVLPYLVKIAVDGPITEGNLQGIMPIGAAYLGAVAAFFVLRFVYLYWLATIGQSALLTIRQELFEHIIKQDMRYFNVTPVGKIVSRMSNDIEAMTELLSTSIVLVAANMVTLAGIIMVMLWMNWRLALISLAVIPIMIVTSLFFRNKIRPIAMRVHQISAAYQAFLNEQFSGMLVVQLFNRQDKTREDFSIINKDYFESHMGLRDTHTYYASILQLMTTFGLALVLWGGGYGVLTAWAGVTIGVLIAFIEYVRQSFDPITQLAEQFGQIQTALSAGERIARMLAVEPMVKESDNPKRFNQSKQYVHFNDVTFGYDPANRS
ncbi:MAG: ABC transporter ATP-binding protein [Anaerolineae bacterium]|nr:ABC transporter ATP-binding protein [Anaerolineae bacterium]